MIKKYFGTDGIRGKDNGSKINGEMFFKLKKECWNNILKI
jgi:hypothetical protein